MAPFRLRWVVDLVVAAACATVDVHAFACLVAHEVLDCPVVVLVHAIPDMEHGATRMVRVEGRDQERMPDAHGLLTTYHAHDQSSLTQSCRTTDLVYHTHAHMHVKQCGA